MSLYDWMICALCQTKGADFETTCGHCYHARCFQSSWQEWHLPCFVCNTRLGKIISHDQDGDATIGIHSGNVFCPCYRVTHPESKIVRCNDSLMVCDSAEHARTSLVGLPVHYNMCVS